ncbi:tetratricopeptide repeat protein [Streptomyces sp. NBC_00237]|uniref:tetratricopeptide repeat protein n=1 Tax=Streptomyces sp. NBC_00237 TaxID=2975687 RepID=UPI002255E876|nr:tetratricopeptide repeat protein [Streptomyces sp. NBC_00237]MCX5201291.1 tetratricopeptide repeat protein [Streptomyces sp. NBC_00237]
MSLERAEGLYDLGRYEQAAAALGTHLASHPDDAHGWTLLARSLRGAKNPQGALHAADQALRLDPGSITALIVRSEELAALGNLPAAEWSAREAVRLAPQRWGTHATVAEVLSKGGPWQVTEAYEVARHTVSLAPEEPYAHFLVGLTAHRLKRTDVAVEAYRTTLRLDPGHAAARHNLALLDLHHRRRGGWKRAAEGFAEASVLDPGDRDGRYNLEVMAWNTVALARWVALLGLAVGMITKAVQEDSGPGALVVGLPALVGIWLLWGWWVRRRMPERLRGPLLRLARGCPPVMWMAGAVGLLGALGVVLAAVPGLPAWFLGATVAPTIWAVFLTYWISRSALRRRSP